MEYRKIINLLDNTPNQPSKSRKELITKVIKLNSKRQC